MEGDALSSPGDRGDDRGWAMTEHRPPGLSIKR